MTNIVTSTNTKPNFFWNHRKWMTEPLWSQTKFSKGPAVNQDFGPESVRYMFVNGVYAARYGGKPSRWAISDKMAYFWKCPEKRYQPKTAK